jgi:chromosomal replication initiator protein
VDATAIVEAAAHGFGVTVSEILGDGRSRNLNPPRICAMAAVRQRTGWSWAQMGRFFNRDHTTVMHHVAHVTASSALSASVDALLTDLQPIPRLFAVPDVG